MEIADLSNMVLKYTKENSVDDSRELMEKLLEIIGSAEGIDRGSFEKLRTQVESMEAGLEKTQYGFVEVFGHSGKTVRENKEYDQYLELYILAGSRRKNILKKTASGAESGGADTGQRSRRPWLSGIMRALSDNLKGA